jgi:hypothetical protein
MNENCETLNKPQKHKFGSEITEKWLSKTTDFLILQIIEC